MLPLELNDDVLLYSPVNTVVDCQNLQEDLDRLVQWADRWPMNFKCESQKLIVYINLVHYTYKMKDHCLNEVSQTNKYLGVSLSRG